MQLVLDTHDLRVSVRNRSFMVASKTESRIVSPQRLYSVACHGRTVWTSAALLLAVEHSIELLFFEENGQPAARLAGTAFQNIGTLRRAQAMYALSEHPPGWIARLFELKTEGQIAVLENITKMESPAPDVAAINSAIAAMKKLAGNLQKIAVESSDEEVWDKMMGTEGSIARAYWPALGAAVPAGFRFEKRSRRPAQDDFNAALNYLYGMLYNVVEGAILAVGLDPSMGILHADEYAEPTLAFDLIEPFRPVADALLVELCMAGTLETRHFEAADTPRGFGAGKTGGITISKEGRRLLIAAMNERLTVPRVRWQGIETNWRNHIHEFAGGLAQTLKKYWENADLGKLRHRRRPPAPESGE